MRVGLVTNGAVYDASPAAFACHVENRRDYAGVANRYLELWPDLLLGSGKDQFLPKTEPGSHRRDDRGMIAAFAKQGYLYVGNKEEQEGAKNEKVLRLFALDEMSFEIDREPKMERFRGYQDNARLRGQSPGHTSGKDHALNWPNPTVNDYHAADCKLLSKMPEGAARQCGQRVP